MGRRPRAPARSRTAPAPTFPGSRETSPSERSSFRSPRRRESQGARLRFYSKPFSQLSRGLARSSANALLVEVFELSILIQESTVHNHRVHRGSRRAPEQMLRQVFFLERRRRPGVEDHEIRSRSWLDAAELRSEHPSRQVSVSGESRAAGEPDRVFQLPASSALAIGGDAKLLAQARAAAVRPPRGAPPPRR